MTERGSGENIVHLPRKRAAASHNDVLDVLAAHFREQNELLRKLNEELGGQVRRLTNGIDRLLGEVNGVRTGRSQEAFARVAATGSPADLPTVDALESALFYTLTSAKIGTLLDFNATEIGHLLGCKGLRWAGDGDFQEVGRWEEGHVKYWHREVPDRLRRVLTENTPGELGITSKVAISMFGRWKARLARTEATSEKLAS